MKDIMQVLHAIGAVLAAAVAVDIAVDPHASPNMWLLPIVFILASGLGRLTVRGARATPWLENALAGMWFIRLVVIPWLIKVADVQYAAIPPYPTMEEYGRGNAYLASEVMATAIVVAIARRVQIGRDSTPTRSKVASFRGGSYVPQAALVAVAVGALSFAGVRERFTFFSSEIRGTAREIASSYDSSFNLLANLANLGRFAAPGLFITLAYRAYQRRESVAYPVLAMIGCVAVNLFYVSTSRASFFVPLLASIVVLSLLFPKVRRLLVFGAGAALVVATVVVTVNKSFSSGATTTLGDAANYLSTYFMGPKEYAIGVRAVNEYGTAVSWSTFTSDLLGNVPVLSQMVDPLNRTSQYYNWTYLGANVGPGGGYIVPGSIQGAFYLGWFLGPLPTVLGLLPAIVGMRYLRRDSQDTSLSYVAALATIIGVLFYANSFSTMMSFTAFPLLPLALLAVADRGVDLASRKPELQHVGH